MDSNNIHGDGSSSSSSHGSIVVGDSTSNASNASMQSASAANVAAGPTPSAGNAMQAAFASFLLSVAAANANNAMQQQTQQAQAAANAQQQQQQQQQQQAARQSDSWNGGSHFATPALAAATTPTNAFPNKQQQQQQQQQQGQQQSASASAGSEVAQLRCYHEKQSRINQFLKHFKELPLHLQSDAFKHPPSFIEPPDLLKALISLPLQSQALIIKQLPLSTQKSLIRALTPREKQRLLDTLQGKPVLFDEDPNDEFCSIPNAYIERASMIAMEDGVAPSANAANQPSLSARLLDDEGRQQDEGKQGLSDLTPVLYSTRLNLFASRKPETLFLPIIQKMMFSFGDVHYVPEEELMQQYHLSSNSALIQQLDHIRQQHQSRQNESQDPDESASALPLTIAWPSLYSAMCIQDYIYQFLNDLILRLPRKQSLQMLIRFFPLQAGVYFRWKRMNSLSKQEQTSKMKVSEEKADGNMLTTLSLEPDDDEEENSNADMDSDDDEAQARIARRSTARHVGGKRKRSGKKSHKTEAPSTDEKQRRGNKKRKVTAAAAGGASDSDAMDEEDESNGRGKSLRRRAGRKNADSDGSSDSSASSSDSDSSYEESGAESSDSSASSDDDRVANENTPAHAALMEDAPAGLADPSVLAVAEHAPSEAAAAKTTTSNSAADGADEDEAELEEVDEIIARATRNHPAAATSKNVTVKQEGSGESTAVPSVEELSSSPSAQKPVRPAVSNSAASSDPISADLGRVSYDFYLPMLDTHLGPLHRLSNQNAISQDMSREHFAEFVKAREASFVSPPRRLKSFVQWLKLPPWLTKNVLFLLGFLAWDRIGMIIEVCGRLRECSRHARSHLPYTVYEIQKAIRVLDAHPQTSLLFLKDHTFVGAVKEEVNEYMSTKRKIARSQQQSHQSPFASPATVMAHSMDADQSSFVAPAALIAQENEAFQHAQLQQLTESIGLPLGMVPVISTGASDNSTAPAASFLSGSLPAPINAAPTHVAAPTHPTPILPSMPIAVAPVNLALPIDSSQSASGQSPFAKPGRFSDKTRLRLLAMSEACGWKYRRSNPEVQAINKEEGLGLEQIRSWMNNNKPNTLKKTIKTSVSSDKSNKATGLP